MSQPIDRAGIFRGRILEYGLREFDSGAVAISVKAAIDEAWNSEEDVWENWRPYDMEATGLLFVVKKNDGGLNNGQIESIVKATDWDGGLTSVNEGTWKPSPCQFVINEEKYKEQLQYRISFVNPYDRVPGAISNVTTDKVKELEARFGGPLRAIAGNAKRNVTPAAEKKMPAPAPKKQAQPAQPVAAGHSDDIPF